MTPDQKQKPGPSGKNRSRNAAVLLALCLLLITVVLSVVLWLRGVFLPRWIHWHDRAITIHTYEPHPLFTDPGYRGTVTGEARLVLSGRKVQIFETEASEASAGVPVFSTDPGWFVSDAAAADLTGDGIEEILLLAWKRGHFGGVLPFWVERDDFGFSQHLYIFQYQDRALQPVWMASSMPADVQEFSVTEDGCVRLKATDGEESLWRWEYWGLKRVSERSGRIALNDVRRLQECGRL